MEVANEVKCWVWMEIQLNLAQTDCWTSIIWYDCLFLLKQSHLNKKKKAKSLACPMCRWVPLVARKWKFAMKIVKNLIKKWQYCNDYQSILSDVDKHQRVWEKNPDKNNTLNIDDNFDENKFLMNYGGENNNELPPINEKSHSNKFDEIERLEKLSLDHQSLSNKDNKNKSSSKTKVNLAKLAPDDDDFEMEERKEEISRQRPVFNNSEEEESDEIDYPVKSTKKGIDNCMILPHLHKHDLYK